MPQPPHPTAAPRLMDALPFWLSLTLLPLAALSAGLGGWAVLLLPLYGWVGFTLFDALAGLNTSNADPETPDGQLFWYRLITLIWLPLQLVLVYGLILYATNAPHLSGLEKVGLFIGLGVITGTIGINYSHELMHQKGAGERWLGDLLLAMVLYGHFRSEHLRVHHTHVGTVRDTVTARYNEGFYRFFARVLWQSAWSAWRAEKALLARAGRGKWHRSNPFWRYWALQTTFALLALVVGGAEGLGLFALQAFVAVSQLELVNYVEHYGLTRKHLGNGKYDHVQPRHSWNAAHRATNWLLINLQRHSDHHYKPDRRFPLLQTHDEGDAPQLPHGYPLMTIAAMVPPLWRRVMNPRVRAWRKQNYPDITDWQTYNKAANPPPR